MKRSATKAEAITPAQYRAFQEAYDFFNAELFAGSLPHVLVTLQRHAKALGYFSPDRFTARTEKAAAHELAMNPDSFTGRTDEEYFQRSPTKWRMSGSRATERRRAVPTMTSNGPGR